LPTLVDRIFFFRGHERLASLVEMIKHIILDMLPFTVFVALLIFAFGLCMFVLHSTHPKDVEGSFGTLQEALFTTVSAWLVARTTRVFNRAHILTFHRRPLYPNGFIPTIVFVLSVSPGVVWRGR
jgi:hypothetical protein